MKSALGILATLAFFHAILFGGAFLAILGIGSLMKSSMHRLDPGNSIPAAEQYLAEGKFEEAEKLLLKTMKTLSGRANCQWYGRCLIGLGLIEKQKGNSRAAQRLWQKAKDHVLASEDYPGSQSDLERSITLLGKSD